MKKKIVKSKFYKLDNETINKNSTGFMFFKHIKPRIDQNTNKIYKRKIGYALSTFYHLDTSSYFDCIQIIEKKKTPNTMKKYILENFNLEPNHFNIVKLLTDDKLVCYLILLDENVIEIQDKNNETFFKSHTAMEMVDMERLKQTNDYWGLLSTAYCKSRNQYLDKCLYPENSQIKLELKIKKLYKALIGYNTIKEV